MKDTRRELKAPRKMLSVESIAKEACQEYYKDNMLKELGLMLRNLSLNEQLSFLKGKNSCKSLFKDVCIENDKKEEITNIYRQEHQFLKAAEYAPTLTKRGMCLVNEARYLLIKGTQLEVDDELVDMLNEMSHKLTVKDVQLKADIRYMIICLTKETSNIRKTIKMYGELDNAFGQMLCFHAWIRHNHSAVWHKMDGENRHGTYC